MSTFRVMAYNILYGGVGREQHLREVVSAIHPDIGVFTEVTSLDAFEIIANVVGPHRAAAAVRKNGQQAVIASRWPIVAARTFGPAWAPHKWIEATVEPNGGPAIRICGVHLVPQPLWPFELARRLEVRRLVRELPARPESPVIIAGDFNARMLGDAFDKRRAELWVRVECAVQAGWPSWALEGLIEAGYIDCYRKRHPRENGFTVPAWDPSVRLDYVFASPSLGPWLRSAGTLDVAPLPESARPRRSVSELLGWKPVKSLGQSASDHLPVWADFEWPPRPL